MIDDYAATFAPALREARTARGLSQYALAKRTELDPSYISRLETAARAPGRACVEAIICGLYLCDDEADRLRLAGGYAPRGAERVE